MIVTLKWLKDFVNLDGLTVKQITDAFTFSGFEIESYKDLSEKLNHVIVGKICKIDKHPNADKLVVCSIYDGKESYQIVTHATNMKVGDYVPMALDGADLANGVKIKPTNMRGVDSCGMMCAGEELGIDNSIYPGAETDGIMIIKPEDCIIGQPIAEVLGMNDVVFDIKVLPNRPDCQCVYGLARELACALNRELKPINLSYDTVSSNMNMNIKVETENCPYYSAQVVKNIKLAESPRWMQSRLKQVGISAHNNIVDITNYVLMEVGQPLHAFDYNKIEGQTIIVRQAKDNEKVIALDENEYKLDSKDIVIANKYQPIGLAGIKGGKEFSVCDDTTDIILESAVFKKEIIRKTSRKIGLRTDASGRYERGIEPISCNIGMARALHLIQEFGVGEVTNIYYSNKEISDKPRILEVSYSRILSWLGTDIPVNDAINILGKLDIKATLNGDMLRCEVPILRADIENFSDIAEELIRYWGCDKLPMKSNNDSSYLSGGFEKPVERALNIKDAMLITGANEIKTYTFIPENDLEKLEIDKNSELYTKLVRIRNPLSVYLAVMRTQTLSSMLGAVKYNLNHKNIDFSLFEVGKTFFNFNNDIIPEEREILSYISTEKSMDFYKLKGITEMIAQHFGVTFNYRVSDKAKNPIASALHPNICADIIWANQVVGVIGKVHPRVLNNFEISTDTYYFEINLNVFPEKKLKKVKQPAKYPSSSRDLALVVDENILVGQVIELIKKSAGQLCESVEFFDVYQGEQLQQGEKSIAVRLVFRKADGTLTQEEVNTQVENILSQLKTKINARLRE